jgi:predicted acylesterase/phospholipase RssA
MERALAREKAHLAAAGHTGALPTAEFLAISGGGADGAFTAGLLNGWTAAGTRPTFKAVTGISTGALIAPFAFLGPEYDGVLREFYTTISTDQILTKRGRLAAIFDDALTDNGPLKNLLTQVVDQRVIDGIAAEYAKGRILLVGTTNLDAGRAVIWNLGEIAASGHPRTAELIRSIMVASAAIPAAFPPVLIDVEASGQKYQEMHVDGGATTQVFAYPPSARLSEAFARERRLYIIRNARLDPDWADVHRRTLPIAGRAIAALIATQGVGDLYRLHVQAQLDQIEYNLAYIPAEFRLVAREAFDREYMGKLFQVGYDLARQGYSWQHAPPGLMPVKALPRAAGAP